MYFLSICIFIIRLLEYTDLNIDRFLVVSNFKCTELKVRLSFFQEEKLAKGEQSLRTLYFKLLWTHFHTMK